MTKQHPITLPPNLRRSWFDEAQRKYPDNLSAWIGYVADLAAQYGADQELEACCQFLRSDLLSDGTVEHLRAARRPKPPSLKEQALAELEEIMTELHDTTGSAFTASAIRAALKQLND